MSDRQIKLITKDPTDTTSTTTISDVNPNASGETMLAFAKMLNGFTNNLYSKSNLVETTNLDTETVKRFVNIDISTTGTLVRGADPSVNHSYIKIPMTIESDITTDIFNGYAEYANPTTAIFRAYQNGNNEIQIMIQAGTTIPSVGSRMRVTISCSGTNTYYPTVATQVITVTE